MADTILIVDDDQSVSLTLSKAVQSSGMEAEIANSGEEALKRLSEKRFDLILMDINMPGMNGIEVLEELKAQKNPLKVFESVYNVIADRKANPKEGSYTNYLFDKGVDKILKKLGEEATEIVIASKNPEAGEIKYEISDFLYHMMVLMVEKEITWEEITTELAQR